MIARGSPAMHTYDMSLCENELERNLYKMVDLRRYGNIFKKNKTRRRERKVLKLMRKTVEGRLSIPNIRYQLMRVGKVIIKQIR